MTKALVPLMKKNGYGRIVNMSSTTGRRGRVDAALQYSTMEAGVLGFTRALAMQLAPFGITVNALCPGLINTEMVRDTISDESVEKYADSFPIKRLGNPEEVSELVMFLASDKAAYITGASMDINGGDLMI